MAEKQIGGRTYRCDHMLPSRAVRMSVRLGKAVAPLLTEIASIRTAFVAAQAGEDAEKVAENLAALAAFFDRADPDETTKLVVDLCEHCQVQSAQGNYESVIFDSHFNGKLNEAFELAVWSANVNFGYLWQNKAGG